MTLQGMEAGCENIATAYVPLFGRFHHGVSLDVTISESPRVNAPGSSLDCTDPSLRSYDTECVPDFAKYAALNLAADRPLSVTSAVRIGVLPQRPDFGCLSRVLVVAGTMLPDRGFVPLGIGSGMDGFDSSASDCMTDRVSKPFGENSMPIGPGSVPLHMAPPHSGLESGDLSMLAISFDVLDRRADAFSVSAIVSERDSIGPSVAIEDPFLDVPSARIGLASRTITQAEPVRGATVMRFEIERGGDTWVLYAPPSSGTIPFPNVGGLSAVLRTDASGYVQAISLGSGDYSAAWTFGRGGLKRQVKAFSVARCSAANAFPSCIITVD
jgi:hypothetical protein